MGYEGLASFASRVMAGHGIRRSSGATPRAQGDIRVAVHAVGLNPVDKIARMGHPDWRFPHILGLDVAGVVDAIGSPVGQWQLGESSRAGLPSSR